MKTLAEETFKSQGHEVKVSDLYQMNFQPVASINDFDEPAYPDYCTYALEQRHAVKTGTLSQDIQHELDKLLWCDLVVFVFPLFWFSTPAILKGWIDRVLVSGQIYGGKRFYDQGGLKGKKALVAFTLGGQQHMFAEQSIHGPIKEMLKPLLQGTLAYTGLDVLEPFVAWHVPYISDDDRKEILINWQAHLENLDSEPVLTFPKLSDFDDKLNPLKVSE